LMQNIVKWQLDERKRGNGDGEEEQKTEDQLFLDEWREKMGLSGVAQPDES